ncbi:hypothetical protein C8Q77DRAFT_1157302 [Trametes polyzona]|nr:hypothetical protein C8Q77DRAFT_1157302 [Trametes polyzona]
MWQQQTCSSDIPLLWHLGFHYNDTSIFQLARDVKDKGPPARQNPDFPDDALPPVPDVDLKSPWDADTSTEVFNWATDFMELYLAEKKTWARERRVVSPGNRWEDLMVLSFYKAFARHRAELPMDWDGLMQMLPPNDGEKITNVKKLLGEPGWFIDYGYAAEHDVLEEAIDGKFHCEPTTAPSLTAAPPPQSHSEDALAEGVSRLTVSEAPDASGA